MSVYMSGLAATISPALKKRMQGKSCFNFKAIPQPELIAELTRLTKAGVESWGEKGWL
jgi:hypothetical protein